jgi:hypothetical protein
MNIQHPTSNTQHSMNEHAGDHWMFDVGRWLLDVLKK